MNCVCCDNPLTTKHPAVVAPFVANRIFGEEMKLCYSVKCEECGALFSDERFTAKQMQRLYAGYRGKEYKAQREKYEPGYGKRKDTEQNYIKEIEKFLSPYISSWTKILDYGGGDGSHTPFKGHAIDVYDIGTDKVKCGQKVDKPHGIYELIICSNLLEHVSYPLETLEEIITHMGSILYLEIPMGPMDYTAKTSWHEHITFFTEKSIEMMLRRSGLRVVDYKRHVLTGTKYYTYLFMLACEVDDGR
jgi:hypothetical protein